MSLLNTILNRRSVRSYADEEISDKILENILNAGLLAPTSRNRKPCEFIVVKNKKMLHDLSLAKDSGSSMLDNANTAIVVIADSTKADTWIEDSSIALAYMDLMANSLGIGSCWCQIHLRYANEEKSEDIVRNILSLENKYRIVGILSLGNKKVNTEPHDISEVDSEKIRVIE